MATKKMAKPPMKSDNDGDEMKMPIKNIQAARGRVAKMAAAGQAKVKQNYPAVAAGIMKKSKKK